MAPSLRSIRTSYRAPPTTYKEPPSPTLSATTSASQLDLGEDGPKIIVTRADLRESVSAYEQLLSSSKSYRNALIALSQAATAMAGALGECARVKGAGDSGEQLLAASGLHYMVANSGQVLSDTLYRSFEVPLMTSYDSYVGEIANRHSEYEALLAQKTAAIRETEAENMRQGRKKNRDLNQFRIALAKLTEQVAEVEVCKKSYYSEVLENETEMWGMIGGKVSLLVRSTLDLADRLASKATSDPIIESMLDQHPDPFDSYRLETDEERDVFTILPPISLSMAGTSTTTSPSTSRKASAAAAAAADKESEREAGKAKEGGEGEPKPAPRELSKAPLSVSDVLGLNDISDEEEDASAQREEDRVRRGALTQDAPTSHSSPISSPCRSRAQFTSLSASHDVVPVSTAVTSSSSPSPPPTPVTDSPALDHSSLTFDPPSLTTESAPFSTLPRPSPLRSTSLTSPTNASPTSTVKPSGSPTKGSRRPRELSRVSESESVDEMAGDWAAPVYGRQLSPAMNGGGGYDSGEEEVGGWRG
ncbi:hypothetical protein JCM11641_005868 [Rhodosporidiobolus odoratus]